jgi:hypothetical protein
MGSDVIRMTDTFLQGRMPNIPVKPSPTLRLPESSMWDLIIYRQCDKSEKLGRALGQAQYHCKESIKEALKNLVIAL